MRKLLALAALAVVAYAQGENGPASFQSVNPPGFVRMTYHGSAAYFGASKTAIQVGGMRPGVYAVAAYEDLNCSMPIYDLTATSRSIGTLDWDEQPITGMVATVSDNWGFRGTDVAGTDRENSTSSSGMLPCIEDLTGNYVHVKEPEVRSASASYTAGAIGGRQHLSGTPNTLPCDPSNPASVCYVPPVTTNNANGTQSCTCGSWTDAGKSCVIPATGQTGSLQTRSCNPASCGAVSYCQAPPQPTCVSSPWTPSVCGGRAPNGTQCASNEMLMSQTSSCFLGSPNGPAYSCQRTTVCDPQLDMRFDPPSVYGRVVTSVLSFRGLNGWSGTVYPQELLLSGFWMISGLPFSVAVDDALKSTTVTAVIPYSFPSGNYDMTVTDTESGRTGVLHVTVP